MIARRGFTLIELSVALVIIGLLMGGVLVGQNLIKNAAANATISQINKYQTAVNNFQNKYGALPGDMNAATASAFGFTPRGIYAGQGDGNGVLEGLYGGDYSNGGNILGTGETAMFWVDLTTANGLNINMIEGSFSVGSIGTQHAANPSQIPDYFPAAKLGNGNFVYAWSGGFGATQAWTGIDSGTGNIVHGPSSGNHINYFGVSQITNFFGNTSIWSYSKPGMTVSQAYNIDKKIDDGLPQVGSVVAAYDYNIGAWAGGPGGNSGASTTGATAGDATSCYDNSATSSGTPGVAGAAHHYSTEIKGGDGINCALSFQFSSQ